MKIIAAEAMQQAAFFNKNKVDGIDNEEQYSPSKNINGVKHQSFSHNHKKYTCNHWVAAITVGAFNN
jgi:hypothetical protein